MSSKSLVVGVWEVGAVLNGIVSEFCLIICVGKKRYLILYVDFLKNFSYNVDQKNLVELLESLGCRTIVTPAHMRCLVSSHLLPFAPFSCVALVKISSTVQKNGGRPLSCYWFWKNCYFPIMWPCDSFIPSPFRATMMKKSWILIKGVYSVYWNDHGVFCPRYSNVFQCMFAVLMNSACRRFTVEVCVYVDQENGSVVSCVAVVTLSNLDTKHWLHE